MSTQQILSEVRQSESRTNLVASVPVQEGQKLSIKNIATQHLKDSTWEDLRGWYIEGEEW